MAGIKWPGFVGTGGGYPINYGDDTTQFPDKIGFADVNSAKAFYEAQALAQKATGLRESTAAAKKPIIRTSQTNLPNPAPVTPSAPPSGFGGGVSPWVEPDGSGGVGYSTGLIPPSSGTDAAIPVYDRERVTALSQEAAAPAIRKLRDQVQTVQGGAYENPNVKALTLRQALQGYGSGLGDIMGSAQGVGAAMYSQEYQPKVQAAMQANELAARERENRYNRAFQAWQQTGKTGGSTNIRGLPAARETAF